MDWIMESFLFYYFSELKSSGDAFYISENSPQIVKDLFSLVNHGLWQQNEAVGVQRPFCAIHDSV